jgi:hypothetical protein
VNLEVVGLAPGIFSLYTKRLFNKLSLKLTAKISNRDFQIVGTSTTLTHYNHNASSVLIRVQPNMYYDEKMIMLGSLTALETFFEKKKKCRKYWQKKKTAGLNG